MTPEDSNRLDTLLNLVLAGQEGALNNLLERLRPYLMLLVLQRQLGPGHRLGDSDLVQETLMRIHRGLDPVRSDDLARFRGQTVPQLLGWVQTIAGHVVVDGARYGLAEKRAEARDVADSAILGMPARGSSPERQTERAEQAVLLAAALDRLPEHQRAVLQWRFFDQLPFDKIAARTGKSVGALRVVCSRALDALAKDEHLRREMEASR
jgi:RNA polymerase sigma-70 factor (ECF subfamily)